MLVERMLTLHRPHIALGSEEFVFRESALRGQNRFNLRLFDAATTDLVKTRILNHPCIAALLQQSLGLPNKIDFDTPVQACRPWWQRS
jgi:hypothetical protein